jgi:Radical SAM superfamily
VIDNRRPRLGAIELPVRRLHVELTNRCNFSCEFCPDRHMRRPRGAMPLSVVERLLAQAGAEGIARQIHFHVMGEPLLWPGLPEAVGLARRHRLEAWVTTNGSLLTSHALLELQQAGLSHLTISLQTPDAATFALRGSRLLSFNQYRDRLVTAVREFLPQAAGLRLSVCFLTNPLRRFHAPGATPLRVGESGKELRAHLRRWLEWICEGTPLAGQLPSLLPRVRKAGLLREGGIPLTPHLDFQVRALGNWAEHFAGPNVPARFGYCPGLSENFGVLWNGDYVICCADYDGRTVLANCADLSLRDYLLLPAVQEIAGGFRRWCPTHPHCRQCLGDRHPVSAVLRQAGSIAYFKLYRRLRIGGHPVPEAV